MHLVLNLRTFYDWDPFDKMWERQFCSWKNEENLNLFVDKMKRIWKKLGNLKEIYGINMDKVLPGNSIENRWDKCWKSVFFFNKFSTVYLSITSIPAPFFYIFRMKKCRICTLFTLTTVSDVARGLLLTADGRQHEDGEGHQPHARRVAQHVTQHCSW